MPVCGPWSDIWGFGALVLDLFFHESEKKESIKDVFCHIFWIALLYIDHFRLTFWLVNQIAVL